MNKQKKLATLLLLQLIAKSGVITSPERIEIKRAILEITHDANYAKLIDFPNNTAHINFLNKKVSLYTALNSAFSWNRTYEGEYFWEEIAEKLLENDL